MKNLFSRAAILLVIGALTSLTAWATTSSRQVTFSRDVTVNGAPVKAGTYKVTGYWGGNIAAEHELTVKAPAKAKGKKR